MYAGANTNYVEPLPRLPHEPYFEDAAEDPPEDDDLDYEPAELTEEACIGARHGHL
jgi:hypothetical protein